MSNNYADLHATFANDKPSGKRCAERLVALRQSLAPVRARRRDGALLLATWNIRDFDSNAFGYGPRLAESFYYIAELIDSFDLVALQEVNRDLSAFDRLMSILGREWDYIVTDATEGRGGNDERMAFVYRRDSVWFRRIAGEVVLPEGKFVVPETAARSAERPVVEATVAGEDTATGAAAVQAVSQFARSPFLVAFQSGWFRFSLCTVHIYYGAESGAKLKRRIAEIGRLVEFFADRQDREVKASDATASGKRRMSPENYILLGDFNVVSPEHQTMEALKSKDFVVPAAIDGAKVRKKGAHFYDQIATRVIDPRFKVLAGGMVDVFDTVFRDDDEDFALYADRMPADDPETASSFRAKTRRDLYRKWRTWQMSDHHPLWVEIATDFSDDYLAKFAAEG